MTDSAWKLIGVALAVVLLLALGVGGGAWLASGHYRPLLDTAETDLASAKTINGNLLALTTEQGLALGGLVQAGEKRQEAAKGQRNRRSLTTLRRILFSRGIQAPIIAAPAFAAAGLKKADSLEVKVRALLAERRQHIGYEKELVAAVIACQ